MHCESGGGALHMAREFQRGHKARLADLTADRDLYVGVQIAGPGLAFDISCFGLDADERLSDDRYFVFYNQPAAPEDAIRLLDPQAGDTASFHVALDRLPSQVRRLTFTASLDGEGQMAQVGPGCLRLVAGGQEVARYPFTGAEFSTERAVMLGDLYVKDVWRFAAVGQGFDGGLEALLTNFGGEVLEEDAAGQAPAASAAARDDADFTLSPPAAGPDPSAAPPALAAPPAVPAPPAPVVPDPREFAPHPPQSTPPPVPQPAVAQSPQSAAAQIHSAPTVIAPLVPPGGQVPPPGLQGPPPPPPPPPGIGVPPPPPPYGQAPGGYPAGQQPPPLPQYGQQPPQYGQQPPPPPPYGQQPPPPPPYGQQPPPVPQYGQQPPPVPQYGAPQGPPVPLPPPAAYGQPGQPPPPAPYAPNAPYPAPGAPSPEDGGTGPWHRPDEPGAPSAPHGQPPRG
ncbi:hypothetical protein GCM10009864_28570 [Streptomyces lunalinharesii]|uniref:TerD domain-containing protein n=1 Tax=Streptomyces lunalinharesii TaxID=333384 RepID=A0ABP6E4V4_9ACTN